MASLKDIKRHIVAVRQTQKLTKAMNMVAAAKLRATQGRAELFRHYADEFARLTAEIGRRSEADILNVLKCDPQATKALILVVTSERGLCGSFNSTLLARTDKLISSLRLQGLEPELYILGRKGYDYYKRRRVTILDAEIGIMGNFDYVKVREVTDKLIASFTKIDGYKEIYVISTKFESLHGHPVTTDSFLPLSVGDIPGTRKEESLAPAALPADGGAPRGENDAISKLDYFVEPEAAELLARLIPRALSIKIYRALVESVTSENAARMQAMDNATKSCKDIIESLTMAYNKARQASVTNELLDIVNGAEALKG
ncbi:MAG: ATP synthase F1 subunit gamma [Deltaproteobacteria bacterium]|jgi:F-type H+-transporting ATPase subunit gamma|nr:ATP synthase F1 subunit gamma [Deltaproteobacteria bacterium]